MPKDIVENESTEPTPTNRAVLNKKEPLVKVRVVKQAVHHEGVTYLGPRQGKNGPLEAQTFECTGKRAEALGAFVARVETPAAS